MSESNGSVYAEVTRKYLNGRIPFRVWFFSSLTASLLVIINNLVHHNAVLEGFFSVFFINLAITIPAFIAQAHFIGLSLQRNPKKVRRVLATVLLICWTVTGIFIAWILSSIYESGWNAGAALMVWNFVIVLTSWVLLSFFTLKIKK